MSKKFELNQKKHAETLAKLKDAKEVIQLGKNLNMFFVSKIIPKPLRSKKSKCLFDGNNQTGNFISGLALVLLANYAESNKNKKNETTTI